jgi:hypothetical protein
MVTLNSNKTPLFLLLLLAKFDAEHGANLGLPEQGRPPLDCLLLCAFFAFVFAQIVPSIGDAFSTLEGLPEFWIILNECFILRICHENRHIVGVQDNVS